ncbi:hypothetical protein LEP1GSC043_1760 [Leptospira weilii str. Ecochallenge]|uniref:Uncharacterized protein n=2 Tax=Leptospira weilii TaxID=28184 RepID=N1UEN1_9LEPT|nr:hypothetical protein LEP1GSC043_1760 [Leptospira weilii str. Ecochallenge]
MILENKRSILQKYSGSQKLRACPKTIRSYQNFCDRYNCSYVLEQILSQIGNSRLFRGRF